MHNNLLVLQSDFGLVDGAVSAMIGVALEESPTLKIHHLTHDITPYNIFVGFFRKQIGDLKGEVTKKELIIFNVVQVIANLLIWGLIAPIGDVMIYKESANKVFLQGVVAGSVNALVVAIAGSLLLIAYARTQTKDGSLSKD